MCQAILDIRAEGKIEGKAELQMHISELCSAMKRDRREFELIDALPHPEKLEKLFHEYGIIE